MSINYEDKYFKLLKEREADKIQVDKALRNSYFLEHWNTHSNSALRILSLLIGFLFLLFFRPDILILIIERFSGCVK